MNDLIIFAADEAFIVPDSEHHSAVVVGAMQSFNIGQIEFYFANKFKSLPNLRNSWDDARPLIEGLLVEGKQLLGEFNGSPIGSFLPDDSGWRARYHSSPKQFETVSFWMADDFTRVWVFA
jgi:hypothetical protein